MQIIKKLSSNTIEFLEEYYRILDEMKEKLSERQDVKNIEKMFICQLKDYLKFGEDLSKNILNYTTSTEVEELANDIIANNELDREELEKMEPMCSENDDEHLKFYNRSFEQIVKEILHKMNNAQTGNRLEMNFISQIIPYLEGGIMLVNNLLQFEVFKELKELVMKISARFEKHLMFIKNNMRNL